MNYGYNGYNHADSEKVDELAKLCEPVMIWLAKNCSANARIDMTCASVDLIDIKIHFQVIEGGS